MKKASLLPNESYLITILYEKKNLFVPTERHAIPTVFSILKDLSQQCKIPVESKAAVVGNEKTVYISAIGNIREFDAGELSGWIYRVNGVIPSVGCGDYILKDGDVVEWLYSLELGNDFREQSR